jgi:GNAT superfamily N-acetyltransferase
VSAYQLAAYGPEHQDDYLGLLREAWGPGSMSREEFEWWFERNPAGSLRSVALAGGKVVGVAAHSLLRMVLDGEERVASFSVHATTRESARGQGIFAALEAKHEHEATERGVAVVLGFASAPTAPIFLGPLGWTEIARLRVWARPIVRVSRGERDPREPQLAGDAAAGWPNHVVRDQAHLAWRYLDSPRGYETLASERGYAVLWPAKAHRGRTIAVLADLVAPDGEGRGLIRRAAARAGSRALFALPAPEQRGLFASLGFAPAPTTLHFVGKALAGELNTDASAWRFTLGDTDFF